MQQLTDCLCHCLSVIHNISDSNKEIEQEIKPDHQSDITSMIYDQKGLRSSRWHPPFQCTSYNNAWENVSYM